jgi:hypothetical protein
MNLRLLAVSDTHLGEDCSLLSFPQGRRHLWEVLRDQFGQGGDFSVDEMILMGDIPDRNLSSTSQIITHTNAFIEMLGSAAKIKKGVYIPGNHDHTIWTKYRTLRYGPAEEYGITGPDGESIVQNGIPVDFNGAEDLLTLFFGYPCGASWRAIQKEGSFDFALANPLYVKLLDDRTYVFTHGTHFRWDVTLPAWKKKLGDFLQLDRILGGIEVVSGRSIDGDEPMLLLEEKVAEFVDSLWPSSRNNPTTQSDQFWYLVTHISGKFGHKRSAPSDSKLFRRADLPNASQRIRRITSDKKDKSIGLFEKYFSAPMLKYLNDATLPIDKITFVYGDTHLGGWDDSLTVNGTSEFRAYNTGGWVVHNKDDHPACHVFGVDENGEELLLDVSFSDVKVEGDGLLDLASEEAENRKMIGSRGLPWRWEKLVEKMRDAE